jgi:hypothetical protein
MIRTMRAGRLQFFPTASDLRTLDCQLIGEAIVRAASITGELSLLAYRDEAALKGLVAFRARWLAYAALLSVYQDVDAFALGHWLGCGSNPLRSLATVRGQSWWDEACVARLFLEIVKGEGVAPAIRHQATVRAVSAIMEDRRK